MSNYKFQFWIHHTRARHTSVATKLTNDARSSDHTCYSITAFPYTYQFITDSMKAKLYFTRHTTWRLWRTDRIKTNTSTSKYVLYPIEIRFKFLLYLHCRVVTFSRKSAYWRHLKGSPQSNAKWLNHGFGICYSVITIVCTHRHYVYSFICSKIVHNVQFTYNQFIVQFIILV